MSTIMKEEWEYEEMLDMIGFGKTQYITLFISGLLTIASMAPMISIGLIVLASDCEFHLNQSEKGIAMAASVTGIFLSTYIFGYISDIYGRRFVLIYCTFVSVILQFFTMFVFNIWIFDILNLLSGISLGGISAAIYSYIGELNTAPNRPIMINFSIMFVSATSVYVPGTVWLLMSNSWTINVAEHIGINSWRLIILFNLLPGLIGALMLLPFPESPPFLILKEHNKEAVEAVAWICKLNTGDSIWNLLNTNTLQLKSDMSLEQLELPGSKNVFKLAKAIWKATLPLFEKSRVNSYLILTFICFGLFFCHAGTQVWYPEIVNRVEESNISLTVCEVMQLSFKQNEEFDLNQTEHEMLSDKCQNPIATQTFVNNMILGCMFLIGFIMQGIILRYFDKRNILLISLVITAFSALCVLFVTSDLLITVFFCLIVIMPGLSISLICSAVVELVPTQLRSKAVSLMLTVGRLGVVVSTNFVALTLESNCKLTFVVINLTALLCWMIIYFQLLVQTTDNILPQSE